MDKDIIFFYNNTYSVVFFILFGLFSFIFLNAPSIYKYLIGCGGTIVFPFLVQDGTIGFLYPA